MAEITKRSKAERQKDKIFLDIVRVAIGLDPLHASLTYQQVVGGLDKGFYRAPDRKKES